MTVADTVGLTRDRYPVSVDLSRSCVIWTGAGYPGYGKVRHNGRTQLAHRVIWEILRGPIPAGLFVCHACDSPPCVQVAHLFLGTPKDNIRDAVGKGRMHPGSRHGMSKLTEPDVRLIRSLHEQGYTGRLLGEFFGVHENTVYHILKGRTWAHV